MPNLPSGSVTFPFTDIEGSTKRWERDRTAMATAVERHLALLRTVIEAHNGVLFKTVGDAVQNPFPTASDTVVAATPHLRSGPLNWPSRACPRPGPFLAKRHSSGHPRGARRRAPAPHRSSAGASSSALCSVAA
jgi:hypothetical protein